MKNTKTPEDVKKGLECCGKSAITCDVCPYDGECHLPFCSDPESDALALIQQLEEDKKRLQERICNQRRQLRVLHAMYEWALGRLQKAKLNDRAHFQAFLRERGYDLATMALPESKYQQLERERDAAVKDIVRTCQKCKHRENRFLKDGQLDDLCGTCIYNNMCNWQWRGAREIKQ